MATGLSGRNIGKVVRWTAGLLVVGILASGVVLAAVANDPNEQKYMAVAVVNLILFAASAAVGCFLGFLFGMPRARISDLTNSPNSANAVDNTSLSKVTVGTRFLANSNFIKVSDWITTIIVGLGLANLSEIVPALERLGSALSGPLGSKEYGGAVGISVLLIGSIAGFILCYLWTVIRVRELLEAAELDLVETPKFEQLSLEQAGRKAALTGLHLKNPTGMGDADQIDKQSIPPGTVIARGQTVEVKARP